MFNEESIVPTNHQSNHSTYSKQPLVLPCLNLNANLTFITGTFISKCMKLSEPLQNTVKLK